MRQVMYGTEIVDVNDLRGWVRYESVRENVAKTLNHHVYLFFQNECHINQFAEGRKFVINAKGDSLKKIIGNARILKATVEYGAPLSMDGYEISTPAHTRNIMKLLSRVAGSISENTICTFSDAYYKDTRTDFNFVSGLMIRTPIEAVDILLDSISFMNKGLLYHYPHYSIIGDSQIKILDDDYQIDG